MIYIMIYMFIGFMINRTLNPDELKEKVGWIQVTMLLLDIFIWPYLIYLALKNNDK